MTPSAWKPVDESAASAWKPVPEQPEDAGFFATIGKDLKDAPKHFMDFITGHPLADTAEALRNLTAARKQHQQRAADAYNGGDYKEAFHQLMFSLPLIGPPAGAAADEMQNGQPGQGAAHAVEVLGPLLAPELSGEGFARIGSAIKSAPGRVAGAMGKVADVATSPVARDVAGLVSPRASHVLSLAGKAKRVVEAVAERGAEAAPAEAEGFRGSAYESAPTGKQFGKPAATPGQQFAEAQGIDYAKLKPEEQGMMEHAAKAQQNAPEPSPRPLVGPRQFADGHVPVAGLPENWQNAPEPSPLAGKTVADLIAEEFARPAAAKAAKNGPLRPPLAEATPPPPEVAGVPPAAAPRAPVRPPLRTPETAPAAGEVPPEETATPKKRSLAQIEADMVRKKPAEIDPKAAQSAFDDNGERKSPQLRAAEITAYNAHAKAQRIAQALHDFEVPPESVPQIPAERYTPEQIAQGATPGWPNIIDELIKHGKLPAGEKVPGESLRFIQKYMRKLAADRLKQQLADEMKRSGTVQDVMGVNGKTTIGEMMQ